MSPVTDSTGASENQKFILSFSNACTVVEDPQENESQSSDAKVKAKPILCIENTSNTCMAKTLVEEQKKHSRSRWQKGDEYDSDCTSAYPTDEPTNTERAMRTRKECLPEGKDSPEQICKYCNKRPSSPSPIVEMTTCEDWQKDLVSPMQRLGQLLSLGHLADVTLSFKTSSEVFKVHRLILATASPVFERMLYGNSKESLTGRVTLHCPPAAMKWVLNNLYLGKTDFPTVYVAIMVFDTAQMYQLSGITALTKDFLAYEVSLNNVSQIFEVAKLHSETELLGACVKKLCSSWPDTLQERLSDLTEDIWMQLVSSDTLPISEVQLFLGLYQWIKMRQGDSLESVTSESIRKEMDKFLPKLRLLSIPSDKFIDHVMPTNIFSPEECSSILLRLRGFGTALIRSVQCSSALHGRIRISQDTMRFVVLNRNTDSRKHPCSTLCDIALIRDFSVSSPVLLHQIQTHDSATLKYAQMTMTDSDGRQEGMAKPYGSHWKFVTPTLMQANKTYTVSIDKVMASRSFTKKEFNVTASDVKFRGTTVDNYLKITFWPALLKN